VVIKAAGAPIGGAGPSAVIPPAEANTKQGGDAATQPPVTLPLEEIQPSSGVTSQSLNWDWLRSEVQGLTRDWKTMTSWNSTSLATIGPRPAPELDWRELEQDDKPEGQLRKELQLLCEELQTPPAVELESLKSPPLAGLGQVHAKGLQIVEKAAVLMARVAEFVADKPGYELVLRKCGKIILGALKIGAVSLGTVGFVIVGVPVTAIIGAVAGTPWLVRLAADKELPFVKELSKSQLFLCVPLLPIGGPLFGAIALPKIVAHSVISLAIKDIEDVVCNLKRDLTPTKEDIRAGNNLKVISKRLLGEIQGLYPDVPVTMQLKIPEPASRAIAVTPVSVEEPHVINLTPGVTGELEPVDTQPTDYSSQQCS
jgi:hypothetical protein